ncbi:Bro-N domain-containing protein [Xylella fastidiosa]|uniref:BRO-N domain-containing protein n=2 Tax=Xylella fastidiosa TaxID=2371 RepID=UPI0028806922|nr:Bro-N domain-containing protein [Xylella fastidiosa]MDS9990886.1 Bro-N domain-containing protein [Xylella fastidiosa]
MKASNDTVSLTTVRRCGTVAGKELKNSEIGGTRIRKSCGFFTPARFTSGGRQPYNTRKGKAARRPISVLNLPTPTGAARKNVSLCSSHKSGDIFMSQSIIPFDFHSHVVRVVMRDGNPWFVAKDIAEALEYRWNASKSISHVPSEWRGVESVSTPSGQQEVIVISEPGLYFFLGRSDKPKALPFQKWLAGEVLPSIRKTGEYTVNPDLEYDQMRGYSKDRKQMEELNTAHSRWISDVRRLLESAGIKEPEFPKGLEDSKAIATSALVELLRWHRWVLDFGPDFRLRLTPVTLHTNFLTSDEVADWVRHPTFPSKHLPDIAKAAIERMSKAFSEKAIGPHMEQAAPKVMGNASRHL